MLFTLCAGLVSCNKNDKVLVMATNAAFPPYEYVEGGKFVGIDVEIATAIAEKLGMELQIEDVEFGSIIGGVVEGKYDMGMAGMTVTDERKEQVNFSQTYATGVQVVIVAEGSDITTLDDLNGKKITNDSKINDYLLDFNFFLYSSNNQRYYTSFMEFKDDFCYLWSERQWSIFPCPSSLFLQ